MTYSGSQTSAFDRLQMLSLGSRTYPIIPKLMHFNDLMHSWVTMLFDNSHTSDACIICSWLLLFWASSTWTKTTRVKTASWTSTARSSSSSPTWPSRPCLPWSTWVWDWHWATVEPTPTPNLSLSCAVVTKLQIQCGNWICWAETTTTSLRTMWSKRGGCAGPWWRWLWRWHKGGGGSGIRHLGQIRLTLGWDLWSWSCRSSSSSGFPLFEEDGWKRKSPRIERLFYQVS